MNKKEFLESIGTINRRAQLDRLYKYLCAKNPGEQIRRFLYEAVSEEPDLVSEDEINEYERMFVSK